jgi:hypothetical protein
MDSILVARIEQRLTGPTQLGNIGAKWVGVTRFAAQSPVANVYRGYTPSRPLHANSAENVTGRETSSGFKVEPDLALVELQTRVEGPPGF